jgi:hypothetical protein
MRIPFDQRLGNRLAVGFVVLLLAAVPWRVVCDGRGIPMDCAAQACPTAMLEPGGPSLFETTSVVVFTVR